MTVDQLPQLLAILSKANVSAFKGFGVELVIGPGPVEVPAEKAVEPEAELSEVDQMLRNAGITLDVKNV